MADLQPDLDVRLRRRPSPCRCSTKVQTDLAAKGWTWGGEPLPIVTIFRLNPAELFLEAYRSTLYGFAMPSWQVWLGCAAWAFGIFGLGSLIFRRFSARIVEEL